MQGGTEKTDDWQSKWGAVGHSSRRNNISSPKLARYVRRVDSSVIYLDLNQ